VTRNLKRQKSTDVVAPNNLTLKQILSSYHDEFFNYLKRVNASRFLDFYDNVQAYRTTVDEVNSYRDERMMAAQFTTGGVYQPTAKEKKSLETMRDFGEFLLDAYEKLAQETRNSIAYNFKVEAAAVKELKLKIQNKSLEPQYDWFDKMAEQAYNFMRTHKKLYPSFLTSRSYKQLFQAPRSEEGGRGNALSSSSSNENLVRSSDAVNYDEITASSSTLRQEGGVFESRPSNDDSVVLSAIIVNYQVRDEGKRHGVYEIEVETSLLSNFSKSENTTATVKFKIYRRYSDFAKLYDELKRNTALWRESSFHRKP